MTDPTPQPAPAVVLTDAETDSVAEAFGWVFDPEPVENMLTVVGRIVATRTADTAARLAAVERWADEKEAWLAANPGTTPGARTLNQAHAANLEQIRAALSATAPDAREGAPSSSSESSGHVDAQTTGQPEAMRLDAPDAGHGPDWTDHHHADRDTCRCGYNGTAAECVRARESAPDAGQREESCDDCGHLASRHWLPGGCHGTQGSIARACRCARNNT